LRSERRAPSTIVSYAEHFSNWTPSKSETRLLHLSWRRRLTLVRLIRNVVRNGIDCQLGHCSSRLDRCVVDSDGSAAGVAKRRAAVLYLGIHGSEKCLQAVASMISDRIK
jgi:hypothetical protein